MFGLSLALNEVRRSEGAIRLRRTEPPEISPWADGRCNQESRDRSPTRSFKVRLNPPARQSASSERKEPGPSSWQPTPVDFPQYRDLRTDFHTGGHTEIRILKLLPGKETQPLSCELVYSPLSSLPEYDALSYCWGPTMPRAGILCDGRMISVTANLASALRVLRRESSTRLLWVDAICIDQNSLDEKDGQVPLMGRIYLGAAAVRIWLGNNTIDRACLVAFSILRSLSQLCARFGWDIDYPYLIRHGILGEYGLPDIEDDSWNTIRNLVELPWFSRTWIIQEVVLARQAHLHCGNESLPWMEFCIGFLSLSHTFLIYRPDVISSVSSYAQITQLILSYHKAGQSSPRLDLLALLENHRLARATDPRDKVYGFLGLYQQKGLDLYHITPAYRRAVVDIFIDAATEIVEQCATLDILAVPQEDFRQRMNGLPSWVPDWSSPTFASSLNHRLIDGAYLHAFNVANTGETPKYVTTHGKALGLSGYCFDEVVDVGYVADPYLRQDEGTDHLRLSPAALAIFSISLQLNWLRLSKGMSRTNYPNGQLCFDAFVRTIYLDDFSGRYSADQAAEYYRCLFVPLYIIRKAGRTRSPGMSVAQRYAYLQYNILGTLFGPAVIKALARLVWKVEPHLPLYGYYNLRRPAPGASSSSMPNDIILDARNRSVDRRMFRTKSGYFGLAPKSTQEGDCIYLVKGSRTPLMMRSQGPQGWQLLGDCYVHGIMQGEDFDETRCRSFLVV